MGKLLLALVLLGPQQQGEVTIVADTQQKVKNIYSAAGHVVVTYQDLRVEADTIVYDEQTKDLEAGQHVRLTRSEERLEGDRLKINLDTKVGVLTNARGELRAGFFIEASEARRNAKGEYDLRDARLTTCQGLHPAWNFQASRVILDTQDRVKGKNSVFRLKGLPFFYLPYLVVPTTRRERSSGFLLPSTSTSTTKGRNIRDSFYYVINRSADLMFTGEYFTERGPAGAVDFRAVPNDRSNIAVNTFFARDRKGQGGWSARILTQSDFGEGFRGVADMNLVSSFVFRQVFEDGFNVISNPIEHSLAYLTHNDPSLTYNILYRRTGTFFTNQRTAVLSKLPSLEVSMPSRAIGRWPVYWSLDSSLAGISRRDAVLRTPSFVERFDLYPALEIPVIRSGSFDWSHRVGVRETAYTHSQRPIVRRDTLNRFSLDYSSQFAGPKLERNFKSWRHVFEPYVRYRYVSGARRLKDTILVDEVDLFTHTNEVEYGITNRFFSNRELLSWRVSQKYFIDPTFGGTITPGRRNVFEPLLDLTGFAFTSGSRRFSPIVSTVRISPRPNLTTDFQVDYDTTLSRFSNAGIIGGLNRGETFFNMAYFFTHRSPIQIPNNQIRATLGYGNELKPGLSTAFSFAYDIRRTIFQGSVAQVGYNTDCCGVSVEFFQFNLGARIESRVRFAFTLKDIGSFGTIRRRERLF